MKLTYEQILEYRNTDDEKFIKLLEELANEGHTDAQFTLAYIYKNGKIVDVL